MTTFGHAPDIARLSRTTLSGHPGAAWVTPRLRPTMPGILHLGLGNFHRAHQAVFTAHALDETGDDRWGIVGAASRSTTVVDALRTQQGAYTVLTLSPARPEVAVVDVHEDLLVAAQDPERLTGWIADPRIRVVTLTVSEHGYTYSPQGGGLDLDHAEVIADLAGRPPQTIIGQLARGIQRRNAVGGAPLTILSCDNLVSNGGHTHRLVTEFLNAVQAFIGSTGDDLERWLETSVTFPSTMVDRIVPRTTDEHRSLVRSLTGLSDQVPVPAEPFSMWAIEDRFAAGRPVWDQAGALMTQDVSPFELMKLRLLNGTHSLIAYLGLLAGHRNIDQAVASPVIRSAAEGFMRDEMLPTLTVPPEIDIEDYCEQLFSRFENSTTGHLTGQVGSDGSLKVPVRITDPILLYAEHGQTPRLIALLVAAYVRCVATPGTCDPELISHLRDPAQPRLMDLARRHREPGSLVAAVLSDGAVFDQRLCSAQAFVDATVHLSRVLDRQGVDAAVRDALT